jgi:hypothetical protein
MRDVCSLIWLALIGLFRSRASLQAGILINSVCCDANRRSVAKYMARGRRPPSQGWKTFFHNHADGIASMDLFVVPAISFRLLYGLLILQHDRRQILWLGVTAHPTAEWIWRQLTEA